MQSIDKKALEKKIKIFSILFLTFIVLFISVITLSVHIQRTMLIQSVLLSVLFQSTGEGLSDTSKVLILNDKGDLVDMRLPILRDFLSKYNSPLEPYAQQLIVAADREGIHYGLLPAIAMIESVLCKKIPDNSFNCWGWGIYGKKVTRFASYGEAIDTVARGIKKNYVAKGLVTPEEIVLKYNPSNTNNWSGNVRRFYNLFQ